MVANTLHPGKSDPQMEKMAIPIRKKKITSTTEAVQCN